VISSGDNIDLTVSVSLEPNGSLTIAIVNRTTGRHCDLIYDERDTICKVFKTALIAAKTNKPPWKTYKTIVQGGKVMYYPFTNSELVEPEDEGVSDD
jgi:hypothetical protein